MTVPGLWITAKGVVKMDYNVFCELDPFHVVAHLRDNLRAPLVPPPPKTPKVVKVTTTVGQR